MERPWSPTRWAGALKREWRLRHLTDSQYRFLFAPPPTEEWVSLSCATTGYDAQNDEILAISAVKVQGARLLCSQRLDLLLRPEKPVPREALRTHLLREKDLHEQGLDPANAMQHLLAFVGSRPVLGYYLDFDIEMIDRWLIPQIGVGLPNETIEVSSLYYAWAFEQLPPHQQLEHQPIDLRFTAMLEALDLPLRAAHVPLDKSVMTALAFTKLRQMAR